MYAHKLCTVLTIGRAKIATTRPAKAMRNMNRIIAIIMTPIVARTVSPAITEFSMISYDKVNHISYHGSRPETLR
jgi:hypothetical protein